MKKKGCLIPVLIVLVALAVGIGVGVSQMTKNPGSTNKETVPIVFDALQYEVKNGKNISETELIEQLGEPDRTEDWNYKTASGMAYPIPVSYTHLLFHPFHNSLEGFKAFRVKDEPKPIGTVDLLQVPFLKF